MLYLYLLQLLSTHPPWCVKPLIPLGSFLSTREQPRLSKFLTLCTKKETVENAITRSSLRAILYTKNRFWPGWAPDPAEGANYSPTDPLVYIGLVIAARSEGEKGGKRRDDEAATSGGCQVAWTHWTAN